MSDDATKDMQVLSITKEHEIQREIFNHEGKRFGELKKWKLPETPDNLRNEKQEK
jgi:hypothetical protein